MDKKACPLVRTTDSRRCPAKWTVIGYVASEDYLDFIGRQRALHPLEG